MQLLLKQLGIDAERTTGISWVGISGGGPLEMWILEGTHPSKSNVQAARCTGGATVNGISRGF